MLLALRRATAALLVGTIVVSQSHVAFAADATERCIADAENAQRARKAGHLVEASRAAISCSRSSCPVAIANDCKTWVAEIERVQPSIVVRGSVDGADTADVTVVLDGRSVATKLDGREIELDPGEHTLRFEHEGSAPVTENVLVVEGERARVVEAKFASTGADDKKKPEAPTREEEWHVPMGTWILGGLGVVAAGAGVGFWVVGQGEKSTLVSDCGVTRVCTSGDETPAKTKLVVGDVLVIAGAAAVAGAVVIAITSHASFRARVDATTASVTFTGTF